MNSTIYAKTGKRIQEDILQDFILGKELILHFDVKSIIERQLVEFAHKTEGQLNEYGFDIDYSNIIFVGGGATIADFDEEGKTINKKLFVKSDGSN